jgi:NADH:ubiquinone oxidoreductase subunit 5 (subunit L)/multisubunit Na+/H+ antiporter MnhA subunit
VVPLPRFSGSKRDRFWVDFNGQFVAQRGLFFPIIYNAFFKKGDGKEPPHREEASWWMVGPILICALMSIILGLNPDAFIGFHQIASAVVGSIQGLD